MAKNADAPIMKLPSRASMTIALLFVATTTADSRVNLSPKGLDALRVVEACRVLWLNLTGSGNETSAHVQ